MDSIYSEAQRALQDEFGTRRLADALNANVVRRALAPMDRKFLEASEFFFLSSVGGDGYPTVSFKGGERGFVRVLDDTRVRFPIYDGNGMFVSMGNVSETAKVGMLFIDFQRPRRLRLHGNARLHRDPDRLAEYPQSKLVVEVELDRIFTNCPRYIPRFSRQAGSEYVPRAGVTPPVPEWKRVDYLQAALPETDRLEAEAAGETISEEAYRKNFWKGLE